MKDIIVSVGEESLFSIISIEVSGMGYSVGDAGENECKLLIADADENFDLDVKYKKLILVSRSPDMVSRDCDLVLRRPILVSELRAGVAALLCEPQKPLRKERIRHDRLSVDVGDRTVSVNSRNIRLSEKEFAIFSTLFKNRGKAVSRDELAAAIDAKEGNEVDVYICYLRRKLEHDRKRLIFTERGVGYKLI